MAKAKTDDKVMQLVEKELEKNPDASVDELYDKAAKVDDSVAGLTKRQFNARYPLQVKRRKGGMKKRGAPKAQKKKQQKKKQQKKKQQQKKKAAGRRGGRSSTPTGGRDDVREVFMRFASDMASAEERKDLVRFLAGMDSYVDDVLKAAK